MIEDFEAALVTSKNESLAEFNSHPYIPLEAQSLSHTIENEFNKNSTTAELEIITL